ncbi:helix-turn-helix domain-containing protein [Halomonas korlensis]|uniref:HTH-type transcriptional regulator / antitoxin HigA n=1 Tax=Halomonas korlensis TaxID=463301 RepID=A0A1I7JUH3_9GAMM|nr:transcriptional regulator [Halomonas korlensis]SFU88824.1 HTH-type transcriptional regulator / antitoxin HigA [Halomonas korlensis]
MNALASIEDVKSVFRTVPFLTHIRTEQEYQDALALVDELIEDVDSNVALIERLSDVIEEWENTDPDFVEFNAGVAALDSVDMLKFLMEQRGLGIADLPEIGSKSLVSKILNRRGRELTRRHIEALSRRFGVSPALFFGTGG